MGIRKKISLGFVIIATILFLSSLVAIFEFNRMRNSVSELMGDNLKSVNQSRHMLELTDDNNFLLLGNILRDTSIKLGETVNSNLFEENLKQIKSKFSTTFEYNIADSLLISYNTYISLIEDAPNVMKLSAQDRESWYLNRLTPAYNNLKTYKNQISQISQNALLENSKDLQEGFYRSIMPGIIAVAAGVMLVLLFNYFINLYFISPIMMILKGIRQYKDYRKTYDVKFENDDEIQELNGSIKSILDENKKLNQRKDEA